ncbi:MAG: argininosuccinate lyase [Phycisphaerae bacterium]|nr:argininosuccinate lyase [Phycisphaerae bacterium]
MKTLWNPQAELHPTFAQLNRCLEADWFLLPFEIRLQRAHATTLAAANVLSTAEREAIDAALTQIERTFAGRPCPASDAEDLHTWIEWTITDIAGDAGRKIHTARSRNDQVATLIKLYLLDAGQAIAEALRGLARVFARQAIAWSDVILPLQTHMQAAAPGNAGFWAMRFATSFDRVGRALESARAEWRQWCPLGSCAVAGSSIPIDRRIQARELGFERPSPNALDSTSTRDECLDFFAIAAKAALHLQSLAADVIGFAQTPFGWIVYPGEFGTGSSMMPNKRNPDAAELIRGEACGVAAAHAHAVLLLKGLPSGYNRDLQCLKPVVHETAERLTQLLGAAAALAERLDFDRERIALSLREGHIAATLRMEEFVREGRPLREAHREVAESLRGLSDPKELRWAELISRYRTSGSASPDETRRAAETLLAELDRGTAG